MGADKTTGAAKAPAKAEGQASGRPSRNSLHKQLRKTKFCMFHLQGACQFGKDCAFAHSVTEMNGTPDLRKTQLCKAFAEGHCDDPQCNFAHGENELRSTDMFFKKSLCIWNEKGKCRNDTQCRFAHGLAELRSYQNGQQTKSPDTSKDMTNATQLQPPSKGGRRRKGKQNQHQVAGDSSGSGSGSSSDNTTRISSSNSPRSGSSSDNSWQQSATEPMKVQPSSVSPHKPTMSVPDQALLAQQIQQMQLQDSLVNRLGALEGALEAARWQQQLNSMRTNTYNPDLQADIEVLRKGIGMLANQCNQIQERMMTATKIPTPYVGNTPSTQLWQMHMRPRS